MRFFARIFSRRRRLPTLLAIYLDSFNRPRIYR